MGEEQQRPSASAAASRSRDGLLGLGVFLFGLAIAVYLNWPALRHPGIYKSDLKQSPHWAAYHTSSFRPDDPLLEYASYNESPLQNGIYWIGTSFVDAIRLSKLLSVASYGLLSLVFFVVGRAMYGVRFGLLLALFVTALPDHWEFSAGFFSKFWMTPLLLILVFVLQTDRPRWLAGLLPFAALAYPVGAVLIGTTAAVHWLREHYRGSDRARALVRYLAIGGVLAVALLLFKYASPPEDIGAMRPSAELRAMPEVRSGGYPSHYIPVPRLDQELARHLEHPIILICAVVFFMVLGRRDVAWERSWTSLFLASAIAYLLADLLFLELYVPNRYTRHSIPLLLALWNARNWDLILARVNPRAARQAMLAALLVLGLTCEALTMEYGRGWTDHRAMTPVSTFIRLSLPASALVAGSPQALDDVMMQGRRSVLCPYKLAHPWFVTYYDRVRERTRASLRAHFAADPAPLDELHSRYGATHFLVDKSLFERALERRRLFADPYDDEIYEELGERREFFVWPTPPEGLYIWEDERYALLPLPVRQP